MSKTTLRRTIRLVEVLVSFGGGVWSTDQYRSILGNRLSEIESAAACGMHSSYYFEMCKQWGSTRWPEALASAGRSATTVLLRPNFHTMLNVTHIVHWTRCSHLLNKKIKGSKVPFSIPFRRFWTNFQLKSGAYYYSDPGYERVQDMKLFTLSMPPS